MSIYLGNTEIGQIYLGSTKVYDVGSSPTPILPEGYTQLEYVVPTTNLTLFNGFNTTWEIDVMSDVAPSSLQIICALDGNVGRWFGVSSDGYNIGGGNALSFQSTSRRKPVITFTKGKIQVSCDGETITRTGTIQTDSSVKIFGLSTTNQYVGRCYGVKCTNGGSFNGVPAKRDSDNKNGLYDINNNLFYNLS